MDNEYTYSFGEWIYVKGNSPVSKHHWYVCPRCAKTVDMKENFCPKCGLVMNKVALDTYNKKE